MPPVVPGDPNYVNPTWAVPAQPYPQPTGPLANYEDNLNYARNSLQRKSGGFGSYKFNAREIKFASQNPREEVLVFLRQHPILNWGWLMRLALGVLMPIGIAMALALLNLRINNLPFIRGFIDPVDVNKIGFILLLGYYSYLVTRFLRNFTEWYFNIYIVTNERVMDFDFKSLISYNVVEARVENIEDVKEKTTGLLPSLFNYGDVYLQTAAAKSNIDFLSIPQPTEVRNVITDLALYARRVYGYARNN